LGTEIEVPTLENKAKIKIPAGTQTGKIFRLRGRGIPNIHGYGRGDLHIKVVVKTPLNLTDEQKKILESFAKSRGENISRIEKGFLGKMKDAFK